MSDTAKKTRVSKTMVLEQLAFALKEQRNLYTYRFVLSDVALHLERFERKEVDQVETLGRITRAMNVYRYEMMQPNS